MAKNITLGLLRGMVYTGILLPSLALAANLATTDISPEIHVGVGTTSVLNVAPGDTITLEPISVIHRLRIGRPDAGLTSSGVGTLNMTGGSIVIVDPDPNAAPYATISIGDSSNHATLTGTGVLNQSGGVINVGSGALNVGVNGGDGTYNLNGNAQAVLGTGSTVYIGHGVNGNGKVNISGNASFIQGTSTTPGGQVFFGSASGEGTITQQGSSVVAFKGMSHGSAFWVGGANNTGAGEGTGTYNLQSGSLSFDNFNIRWGNNTDGVGTLNQSGGTLLVTNSSLTFGAYGTGVFNLSGGTATFKSGIQLASHAGSTGTVNLTGGIFEIGGTSPISFGAGTAAFNFAGGTLRVIDSALTSAVNFTVVDGTSSNFNLNGLGATLSGNLLVGGGSAGSGTLNFTGNGTVTFNNVTTYANVSIVGGANGAIAPGAKLIIAGSASGYGSDFRVGDAGGTGTFLLAAGQTIEFADLQPFGVATTAFRIGNGAGSTGIVTMTGGLIDFDKVNYGAFHIGTGGGNGTLNQSSGLVKGNSNIFVGYNGGTGVWTLSGDAQFESLSAANGPSSFFDIGIRSNSGTASNGTVNLQGNAKMTFNSGLYNMISLGGRESFDNQGVGRINQTGAGSEFNVDWAFMLVGYGANNAGYYTLENGAFNFNGGEMRLAEKAGSIGQFNQSGGTSFVADGVNFLIGNGGQGLWSVSGGTATFETNVNLAVQAGSSGTFDQTGGVVSIAAGKVLQFGAGTGVYKLHGGELQIGGANGIAGAGGLLSLGGGTLKVTGSALTTSTPTTLVAGTTTTINTNGLGATFDAGFGGDGGFIKTGAGDLVLGGTTVLKRDSQILGGQLVVGGAGAASGGSLTLSSGVTLSLNSAVAGTRLVVGGGVGAVGSFVQNGGHIKLTANGAVATMAVGYMGGTGVFTMNSGTIEIASPSNPYGVFMVGGRTGSNGTFIQNGGKIEQKGVGNIQVGVSAIGVYTLSGNAEHIISGAGTSFFMGTVNDVGVAGHGTINLLGNAKLLHNADTQTFWAGVDSTAIFNQKGAGSEATFLGNTISRAFQVGDGAGGVGTYNLEAGSATFDTLTIRWGGAADSKGVLNQSGGTLLIKNSNLTFGQSGEGEFNLSGGVATIKNALRLANAAGSSGKVNLSGTGVLEIGGTNGITAGSGTYEFNLGGGTLKVIDAALTTSINFNVVTATTTIINTNEFDATLSGGLTGSGALHKTGAGNLILSAAQPGYTGNTKVSGGYVQLGQGNSLGSGDVTLEGGGLKNAASSMVFANDLTVSSGFTGTILPSSATTFELTGDVTVNGATFVIGDGTATGTVLFDASNVFADDDTIIQILAGATLKADSDILSDLTSIAASTLVTGTLDFDDHVASIANLLGGGVVDTGLNSGDITVYAGDFSGDIKGARNLIKDGAGVLSLTQENTYAGTTTVLDGKLSTSHASALGDGGVTVNGANAVLAATGILNVADLAWINGYIQLTPGAGSIINSANLFSNGGSGGQFYIDPTGLLAGVDYTLVTFTGTDFVESDFIALSPNSNVQYDATFVLSANDVQISILSAAAAGNVLQNSAPIFIPTIADFTVDGPVTTGNPTESNIINSLIFNDGSSLKIFNDLAVTSGAVTTTGKNTITGGSLSSPTDFTFDVAGDTTIGSKITGAGAVYKIGNGTLGLSGANTYAGGTVIQSGTVTTQNLTALGTGSVVFNNGALNVISPLRVKSLTWNDGKLTLPLQAATGLTVDEAFTKGGGEKSLALAWSQTPLLQQYSLIRFGDTNFGLDDFSVSGLPVIPNVSYTYELALTDAELQLLITDAVATGSTIQNSGPYFIPTFANFIVNGPVSTGSIHESNTIGGLTFLPDSSLLVHQNLTVTSGDFNVNGGSAAIQGGHIITPGDFNKWGVGKLQVSSSALVGGNLKVNGGVLGVNGRFNVIGHTQVAGGAFLNIAPGGHLSTASTGISGRVAVNGVLQSPFVHVHGGGVLQGNGLVIGNVQNDGTVAPGNSIGLLTIHGNYTQSHRGALEIEVAAANDFDVLVVSGLAKLAGTLEIGSLGYSAEYGDQIPFLVAGKISGKFDQIEMPNPHLYRGRFLNLDQVGLLLVAPASYTLVAESRNEVSVARALDKWIGIEEGDIGEVTLALDLLREAQYASAFQAIMPGYHEAALDTATELGHNHSQLLHQYLGSRRLTERVVGSTPSPAPLPATTASGKGSKQTSPVLAPAADAYQWKAWTQGSGLFSSGGLSLNPGEDFESGTFMVGADYLLTENFAIGLFASYQEGWGDYDHAGDIDFKSTRFGGYATIDIDGFYANAVVGGGQTGFDIKRPIQWATLSRVAESEPDAYEFFTSLGTGYDVKRGNWTFGPQVVVQYNRLSAGDYRESGAGVLDLALKDAEVDSLRSYLGGRIAYTIQLKEDVAIIPEFRASWQHEYLDGDDLNAYLDGGAGPGFVYETESGDADRVNLGFGIGFQIGARFYGNIYYNAEIGRNDDAAHAISVSGQWKF